MKIDLKDFMAKLDGMEYNDRALIDNCFFQCDRIAHESKKPFVIKVSRNHDRVCMGKVEGYDDFNILIIYYTVNGQFFMDEFATKPVYPHSGKNELGDTITVYSEYRHTRFGSKAELAEYMEWEENQCKAIEYAKSNYYFDTDDAEKLQAKQLIDGFFTTWNHVAQDIA